MEKEHKLPVREAEKKAQKSDVDLKTVCDSLAKENMSLRGENTRLRETVEQARTMLDSLQTQNLFAYLSALNKVMDNAPIFGEEFVQKTASAIEEIMDRLHDLFLSDGEHGDNEDAQAE